MTDHRFQGYGHPELYKMINSGPGVSASIPVEQGWKTIAATLAQIDADLHTGLAKMGADWESDAADAAQGALSPLAEWAGFAETGATTMESSARLQGEYIADARKKMPEVVPITTEKPGFLDIAAGALTGPAGMAHVIGQQQDHERQEAAADNAAAKAVQVMEDYQSDSRWNSSTLGEFPTPPQVVIDTPPPADTGTGSTRAGYSSTGAPGPSGNGTTTPSWATPVSTPPQQQVSTGWTPPPTDTTHTSWTQPPTTTPPPTHTPPPTTLPNPGQTHNPTPTPPGGPVFTRPGTTGPGGTGGSSSGVRAGQAGGGAGGGKAFGSMSGSLGSAGQQGAMKPGGMPGGLSGAMGSGPDGMRGGAMGSGAGAGKGGAAGGGMGGGGAHGQKGEGEDDIEHKAADYLVETDDVFGDERMVAPPVIGGASE
jgi:hypothetical protein